MPEDRVVRRLAAILVADVVGYSRLMGADELDTLARLKELRNGLLHPSVQAHGGRIVKTSGDGTLIEFASAVDAVQHAVEVQTELAARNRDLPPSRRIEFRMGINVGDIIVDEDDIFGDGVNVAARLETLAAAGGICLSGTVFDQIRGKLDLPLDDLGPQSVKNIAEPIRVYQMRLDGGTSVVSAAPVSDSPALPEKPSIAVLPFTAMGSGHEHEEFADGMTEDLITDRSKISGLFVVARNSSFAFRGQAVDVREIAQRLGVRYVLEGSLRKAGARVRINAQLIDAATGGHIWADRYDGALDDVFELQDEVCAEVVAALSVELRGDERDRLRRVHTNNLEAYELYIRAKATPYPPLPERIRAAREMFEQVIELDPDFAGGYAGAAWTLSFDAMWSHEEAGAVVERAMALAQQAIGIDETFAWSHTALGFALLNKRQHDDAMAASARAIALQPNDADAHAHHGLILGISGQYAQGIAAVERAIPLNPQFVYGP